MCTILVNNVSIDTNKADEATLLQCIDFNLLNIIGEASKSYIYDKLLIDLVAELVCEESTDVDANTVEMCERLDVMLGGSILRKYGNIEKFIANRIQKVGNIIENAVGNTLLN